MNIVLEPLIDYGVEAVAALVGLFATWTLKQGADWLGVRKESEMYAWIEDQVDQVLAQAQKRVQAGQLNQASFHVDSELVGELARTVVGKAPKYLRKLGLGEADVKRMVAEQL